MYEGRFAGQVALVTGGARGIGAAIGQRLAKEGAQVILWDVLESTLVKTTEEVRKHNLHASYEVIDITDKVAVAKGIDHIIKHHDRLDVMVHCAAISGPTSTNIVDYSAEDFRHLLDVNLYGSFLVTKYAIPPRVDKDYGRILLIASIGGKEGNPGMAGYAASKSGVLGLVKAIGKEYAHTGITINGLAPAVISTPMNLDTHPDMLKYMIDKIPMGRLGTVEEVASMACWILSKEASFNTGFNFDLSGGRATY